MAKRADADFTVFISTYQEVPCTICQKPVVRRVAHSPDAKFSIDPVTVFFGCGHIVHMRCVRDRFFIANDQLSCPRCTADTMGVYRVSVDGGSAASVDDAATAMWREWTSTMESSRSALTHEAMPPVPGRLPIDVGGDEAAAIMRASVNAQLRLLGPTGAGRPDTRAQSLVSAERLQRMDNAMEELMTTLDKQPLDHEGATAWIRGDVLKKVLAPTNVQKNAKRIAEHGLLWTFLFDRGDLNTVLKAAPNWPALLEVGMDRITRTFSTDGNMTTLYQWPGALSVRSLVQHPFIRLTFEMFWSDICKRDYELLRVLRVPETDLVLMRLDFELQPAIFVTDPEALCTAFKHIKMSALVTRFNLTRKLMQQVIEEASGRGDRDKAERLCVVFGNFAI